ncbi:hypothetical protein [Fundidesulfovibrio butyratiphilus]
MRPQSLSSSAGRVLSGRPAETRPVGRAGLTLILVVTLLLAVASLRGALFAPGHISQNWDQTVPPFPSEIRTYGSISADSWSSIYELGSPATFNGISWMFDQIMRKGLAFLGGPALAKGYFLLYALVGAAGFGLLSRRLGLSFWPALCVCLISQFGPRTYSLVVSGHAFESGFALAATPWMVFALDTARAARGPARLAALCAAALAAGLGSSTSPFGIVFVGVFLALWTLGALLARPSWRPLALAGFVGLALVLLHLHWLVPAALTGTSGAKYNQRLEDVRAHYESIYRRFSAPPGQAMIGHTDNLGMGTEYAYPVEPPRDAWWKPSAYALLALALLGLLHRGANPALARFAAACLLLGFLMMAGAQTNAGRLLYEGLLGRVSMVFFLMARPARWLPFYQAGLALMVGMGLETLRRRRFWTARRWIDALAVTAALAALALYLEPWWSGELTRPKNATTQTMSLALQPVNADERRLVAALERDPGDYRITVLPTISGPTGNVPAPPATSLTRNFGLTGKDSLMGPAFVGQPYGRFLLSLSHRRTLSTDRFGRLLGLGAVKRVFFDRSVPYLSYLDFGWMPATKRGAETLSDPRGILGPFVAAQKDLIPDPAWTFGPILGLDNRDFLPRVRVARHAGLAGGGLALLAALAELPGDLAAEQALFFGTDVSAPQARALASLHPDRTAFNGAWPELLLPFLPDRAWLPAWPDNHAPPRGWTTPRDRWHHSLWFSDSPLNGGLLWSVGPAELALPLPGKGPHRLLARLASLPGQYGISLAYGETALAQAQPPAPLDRGWRWIDLGVVDLDGTSPLTVRAQGRGAVFAGVLCLPEADFHDALAALDRTVPPGHGTREVWTATACVQGPARPFAETLEVPLLADFPGLSRTVTDLAARDLDGSGPGTLTAEGEDVGRAEFALALPPGTGRFALECYPRLFGDRQGLSFVRAEWSLDGRSYHPLFEVAPEPNGKWEDVYGRRMETAVLVPETTPRNAASGPVTLHLRFALRQAQLSSLGNPPNQPMRLVLSRTAPLPAAPALGQGVRLPARLLPVAHESGVYRIRARILTAAGARWVDLGRREAPEDDAAIPLDVTGPPGSACDLVVLESRDDHAPPGPDLWGADAPRKDGGTALAARTHDASTPRASAFSLVHEAGETSKTPPLHWRRVNQGRYVVEGLPPEGGVLVFAECYHPRWLARWRGVGSRPEASFDLHPVQAYGFANAYVLGQNASPALMLEFSTQPVRERFLAASLGAWGLLVAAFAVSAVLAWRRMGFSSDRDQARGNPTP